MSPYAPVIDTSDTAARDLLYRTRARADGMAFAEEVLKVLPAAIYTTDADGRITFFNEAAAELWGVRPELGTSEFCGSWKLYWRDGTPLRHDECPMAMTLD